VYYEVSEAVREELCARFAVNLCPTQATSVSKHSAD
jgi:ferredoxin